MYNNIVVGEPGIFPDPIARLLVRLGRLGRKKQAPPAPPEPGSGEAEGDGASPPGPATP